MVAIPDLVALILCLLISLSAALPGAIFRPGAWYRQLTKPSWRPPDRLFAPVWLVLYLMMGTSVWLIWRQLEMEGAKLALGVYALQLVLNGLWSVVFFALCRPALALIEITGLWLSIAFTIYLFYQIDARAAWLLGPYILWVSFACALNFAIWRLNPERSS